MDRKIGESVQEVVLTVSNLDKNKNKSRYVRLYDRRDIVNRV